MVRHVRKVNESEGVEESYDKNIKNQSIFISSTTLVKAQLSSIEDEQPVENPRHSSRITPFRAALHFPPLTLSLSSFEIINIYLSMRKAVLQANCFSSWEVDCSFPFASGITIATSAPSTPPAIGIAANLVGEGREKPATNSDHKFF